MSTTLLQKLNSLTFKICYLLIIISSSSIAQKIQTPDEIGFPLVKNYIPKEYSANVQNWAIVQDKRGVMYFGNGEGVLEYDGTSWRLIKIPNDIVRCLTLDEDGKIFVGGINEIGYLEADSSGLLKYISLNKYISKDKINFGDVWSIVVQEEGLYFQTFSSLFFLESNRNKKTSFLKSLLNNPSIQRWESRTRFNPIHSIGKRIFVHERNVGLQELINGKFIMLPGGEEFAQDLICIMLPFPSLKTNQNNIPNNILIGSLRRGLYLFDGSKFTKFRNEADDYLIENRLYYRGAILGDGSYALGTQVGGIVVIDQNGKLKRIFNKNTGINNNTIWDLFPDREGNLWAALDNGISKILYPSSSKILNEKSGFEGTIHAINNFGEKIYIATSSGIYFFQHGAHDQTEKVFTNVPGVSVQSWDLLPLHNKLLAATNDGIIEIINSKPSIIDINLRYVYCLYKSIADTTIIYAGLHNGLAVLKNEHHKLFVVGVIPNFQDGILDIQEDEYNNLWLSDISGKIIRITTPVNKLDITGYRKKYISNDLFSNNKTKLLKYQNQIYFYNYKNVLLFDKDSNKFIASKLFTKIFTDTTQNILHIYNADDSSLWCAVNADGKTLVLEVTPIKNEPVITVHSFLEIIGDDFSSAFTLLKFYVDKKIDRNLWVSDENNLVQYAISTKTNLDSVVELRPLIRRVSSSDGNILFNGYGESSELVKDITEITFSQNSIVFEFASPSYLNEESNDYQYMLEGFNDVWSNWSLESKKEYTNLPSGNYIFKVRTRNALGKISQETSFNFIILPPWYKTWWANLLGFLIVLLFINYVIKFRVRYLKNKNTVLEKLVNERTAKIIEQKETLENQAKKLLELDQLKSAFFANISHEFRTPLTLIKGQLENVLQTVKDTTIKKKLNIAFNNSNRLNRLINQVLDLSKLESGKIKLEFELSDIVPLLRNRIASFESLAEQKNVTLEFNTKIESLWLNIDKEKVEEVIDNLLSNAFKFTPANGIISILLDVEESEFENNALIIVNDTGIGIPEDKLEHIFDRFYQADNSSTKQYEGTGLGLSIVKELIELHGGSIKVTSKVSSGTRFSVYLPIEENELILPFKDDDNISENLQLDVDKSLILIVEDNTEVRNYIKENLEKHYRIDEAVNGEEGILKAINIIPDLIITDVMMPKVDGFELCNKLKNDQRTSHIPIVILTAKADEENKLDGLQIGADEFLAKPFSPRELEIRVGNLIHIRQLLREKYREISVIKSEDVKANPIDKEFLEKVFTQIKNHIEDQQFSVQKLADDMAMSVSQINRKLNALINQSAGKLIRSTKLDYAAKLLEKNAGNITEIAYRVGFSDLSSFTNSFKEKFKISPSEYLKKHH